MSRRACWLLLGLCFSLPTGLAAQACLGVPQGRQLVLSAFKTEPPHAERYGGTLVSDVGDHNYVSVQAGLTSYDGESWRSSNDWDGAVTIAHELQPLRPTLSVCPAIGARYSFETNHNVLSVPAGVAAGKTLGPVTLYAFPHFLWLRDRSRDYTNTYAAMDYGVTVALGSVMLQFTHSHLLEQGARMTHGFGVGLAF